MIYFLKMKFLLVHSDGADSMPLYHKRKNYYKYQRSERLYPFKKRKHVFCASESNSEGGICNEFISNSLQKGSDGDAAGSTPKKHGGLFLHTAPILGFLAIYDI